MKMAYWKFLLRRVCGKFGKSSRVNGSVLFYCPWDIVVGENCTINEGVMLNANHGKITIGNNVRISPYVLISTAGLNLAEDAKERHHEGEPIVIEDDVWVGMNAIILPGVTLKKGCVVAAGAVVTKDVSPKTMVAGVPAVEKKKLR